MAGSSSTSLDNTHLQDPNPPPFSSSKPPKSKFPFTHYFFSKSLIILLVLLVFSFFPSQVPEFFKKTTIATKLWELFYLLVIGIAVCYGLFSRKIDRVHSSDDNTVTKETYLSGISHISSIFEDGIQTSYGFDEKDLFEEFKGSGSRLSAFGNGFGESDEKKLNQYFLGESMVVINDENYVLEQLSKPKTVKQNKPLCLPVRSLGSKSLDSAVGKSNNGGGCDSVVNDSLIGGDGIKNRKFRGLVPIKLEEKFKETDCDSGSDSYSSTPLNWRSKSMRLEKREDLCSTEANRSSNSRPISVGVGDFKGLRSKSMRFSMPTPLKKSSEKEESEGIETNHVYRQPHMNGDTSFIESNPREFSIGTSSDKKTQLSFKEILKDSGNHGGYKEILKDFGNHEILKDSGSHGNFKDILKDFGTHGSSKEILKDVGSHGSSKEILKDVGSHGSSKEILKDVGSHGSSKEFLKDVGSHGRSKEILKDFGSHGSSKEILKDSGRHGSYKEILNDGRSKGILKDFGKIKVEGGTFKKEEKPDSSNSSPKAVIVANTYRRGKSVRTNRSKEQVDEAKIKKIPNDNEGEAEKGSKLGTDVNLDDIEPHSGEVDRKAEEFIAKFREQIRLQQVAPSRRLNL